MSWLIAVRRRALAGSIVSCVALWTAFGSPPATATSAPLPPVVYTGEATQLTTASATLNGSVNPSNQSTSSYFQYGGSAAYEEQTPTTAVGVETQSIHVSAPVAGLAVYTTYHYRLVAVNPAGTTYGPDRTFTTRKIPLSFKITATSSRDLFGSPFAVSGTLSGTGNANHPVVLQANPFPYLGGFKTVSSAVLTDATGFFSFAGPGWPKNTQMRVATLDTPPVDSPVLVELVAVRVSLHIRSVGRRGFARLYGTVTPAEVGSSVEFQELRRGHPPLNVSATVVKAGNAEVSRFSSVLRIRHAGLYRAIVSVLSGAQVSNHSRAILIGRPRRR